MLDALFAGGSSPRGRGTVLFTQSGPRAGRFIPAWAGTSLAQVPARSAAPVHPRVGGEQGVAVTFLAFFGGSSPRGRGTEHPPGWPELPERFIPAWAGNRADPRAGQGVTSVHPRVGGEQAKRFHLCGAGRGSSPRGRGTDLERRRAAAARRFIPAWAGNSKGAQTENYWTTVHPRVGGEQVDYLGENMFCSGSSPRGRGTGQHQRGDGLPGRFIPAWAGNSRSAMPAMWRRPVHPRVGGEQSIITNG